MASMRGFPPELPARSSRSWGVLVSAVLVLAALVTEAGIGYGERLHARLAHPVTWIGTALAFFEHRWNRPDYPRKLLGIVTLALVAGAAAAVGALLQYSFAKIGAVGAVLFVLAATLGLAQRSLHDHVHAV